MSAHEIAPPPNSIPRLHVVGDEQGISSESIVDREQDPIDRIIAGVDPASVDESTLEDLIDEHPLAQELAVRLKVTRANSTLSSEAESGYVQNIKNMREEVGRSIKERLGIVEEDPEISAQKAERERIQALGGIFMKLTGEQDDDELLKIFGLVDESGKMTETSMHSPLFRADTKQKFDRYLRFAIQYDAMEQAEALVGTAMKNTQQASNMRGEAHNAVARLVERDLGLPFDQARRFIAKARDAVVPGLHERQNYSALLRGEKLANRHGHDAAAFAESALKDLIESPMPHEKPAQHP